MQSTHFDFKFRSIFQNKKRTFVTGVIYSGHYEEAEQETIYVRDAMLKEFSIELPSNSDYETIITKSKTFVDILRQNFPEIGSLEPIDQ